MKMTAVQKGTILVFIAWSSLYLTTLTHYAQVSHLQIESINPMNTGQFLVPN